MGSRESGTEEMFLVERGYVLLVPVPCDKDEGMCISHFAFRISHFIEQTLFPPVIPYSHAYCTYCVEEQVRLAFFRCSCSFNVNVNVIREAVARRMQSESRGMRPSTYHARLDSINRLASLFSLASFRIRPQ